MRLVGELVLTRNQIVATAATQAEPAMLRSSQRLNLLVSELQAGVMKTRMQPIDTIWSKLPRVVRDLGVTCGREVRLVLQGRETELDGSPNLGYKVRYKEGYFPVSPMDQYQDLRSEMLMTLERVGIPVEVQHHEVGTAGQAEIDMRFDTLSSMADKLMLYKYICKNVAWQAGKVVTFMPKPLFQDNGSGMHTHQSLWNGG